MAKIELTTYRGWRRVTPSHRDEIITKLLYVLDEKGIVPPKHVSFRRVKQKGSDASLHIKDGELVSGRKLILEVGMQHSDKAMSNKTAISQHMVGVVAEVFKVERHEVAVRLRLNHGHFA